MRLPQKAESLFRLFLHELWRFRNKLRIYLAAKAVTEIKFSGAPKISTPEREMERERQREHLFSPSLKTLVQQASATFTLYSRSPN